MTDTPKKWDRFLFGEVDFGSKKDTRIEVFVSPTGSWYKRAADDETPDLEVPSKHRGISPIRLVCIDSWRPQEEVTK